METKTIKTLHEFEKIIKIMTDEFGTFEEVEEDNVMVLYTIECNLLKINRRTGINNSRRASEAVKICLHSINGYIKGHKYNTDKFSSPEANEYVAAIQYAFDPFANEELTDVVGQSYDLSDPDDLWSYYEMPVQCLLRIEKSMERLSKSYGASGYFDLLEEQFGIKVKDDKLNYTVMIGQNLPIDPDMLRAGQLADEERDLFFAMFMPLLAFVNKKHDIVNFDIIDEKLEKNIDYQTKLQAIRDRLWEEPELISDYIELNGNSLPKDVVSLLESWQKYNIKGQFVVVEYDFEHAVFMRVEKGHEQKVYAVKGISDSVAVTLGRKSPILLETVLLPFGNKIIYDSLFAVVNTVFGPNIRESLEHEYNEALEQYGMINILCF